MAIEIIMPKVDMDQETGTISEWKKHNGDQVKEGETILVIETAKVAIDVEAPATGTVSGITAKPGEVIPIATVIGYILGPGESQPAGASTPAKQISEKPVESTKIAAVVEATPVARNMAQAVGLELGALKGSGPQGKITRQDVELAMAASGTDLSSGKINATPAARRIALEMGVNLDEISGSGPAQRIQACDVARYKPASAQGFASARQEDEIIPLMGMRATIAQRLTMSYQTIPHIKFVSRINMSSFNQTRASLNVYAEKTGGVKISATAMFVKIVAAALTRHPYLNASLKNDTINLHRDIHMGVAVALDTGLIVPVVHDATKKSISQIALEIKELAENARLGQLQPSNVSGGTFTISNLGPFGVEQFDAIINPPQSAILAIGATQDEVVPVNHELVIRPIMHITLSADHRVVDGAVAAKFLADLKTILETPQILLY